MAFFDGLFAAVVLVPASVASWRMMAHTPELTIGLTVLEMKYTTYRLELC
jgi:hypothetical protein